MRWRELNPQCGHFTVLPYHLATAHLEPALLEATPPYGNFDCLGFYSLEGRFSAHMLSFFRLVNVARVTNTSLSGLEALRCAPFLPISARIHTPIVGHTTEILVWILNTLAGFKPA